MAKKFSLLLAAVAVLAFAIPAMANAATLKEGSSLVPTGTEIFGTGTDVTLTSNLLSTITCEKLTLKGKVTDNGGTSGTVIGSGTTTSPGQTNCKNGTKPVVVNSVALSKLFVESTTKAYATFSASVTIGKSPETVLNCTFEGTEIPGTFTSGTGNVKFTAGSTFNVKGTPSACGNAKLSGEFKLETTNGTEVQLNE
jgi:hypothetical protein